MSVRLCGSHTFLVVTHSYVSHVTHAFLGMLPLCFLFCFVYNFISTFNSYGGFFLQIWTLVSITQGYCHLTDITGTFEIGMSKCIALCNNITNWSKLPFYAFVFHMHIICYYSKELARSQSFSK